MNIIHTSETESGQIYVSQINWIVMAGVILLVLIFRSSDNLASAYGIAVNVAMLINTLLGIIYFWKGSQKYGWLLAGVLALVAVIELAFLAANSLKIANGGYLPILIGIAVIMLIIVWRRGIGLLQAKLQRESTELGGLLESLERRAPARVAGAAVFLQTDNKYAPSALMHNLKHNRVLHDRLVFLAMKNVDVPRWYDDRVSVKQGPMGAWIVEAKFGYMEQPDVQAALRACASHGLEIDPRTASYFLGRRVLKVGPRAHMPVWQQRLFIMMANQSARAIDFFRIPPDRVVELGMQMSV
jgi:KUP system potassium uptake protein